MSDRPLSPHSEPRDQSPSPSRRRSRSPPSRGSRSPRRSPPPPRDDRDRRSPPRDDEDSTNPGTVLYIAGLSSRCDEKDILRKFEQYGKVKDVNIVKDPRTHINRGFCFLEMESAAVAAEIMEKMKDRRTSELDGRWLQVEISRRGKPRPKTPGQYLGRDRFSSDRYRSSDRDRYAPYRRRSPDYDRRDSRDFDRRRERDYSPRRERDYSPRRRPRSRSRSR